MKQLLLILSLVFFACGTSIAQIVKTQPVPTPQQLAWHGMEFYLFMHFGPNTFTDLEWGHGNEKEEIFNPKQIDCNQWCRIAKAAGAKGIIITAKHHDGFCLWPSRFSTHTVRESKWKNGKGDVLKELSVACKKAGLKFGVYISPWDRNHPDYGTEKYNDVFVNMMKEVLTNYGPVWELWWDGANGEGPNGKKQVYDWKRFEKTVRTISPNTVVFSDIGPDIRWCGNENGIAGKTNWNNLDTAGFNRGAGGPPQDTLNNGNMNGTNWLPAECDVSIRPGWFYHSSEDDKVKSPEQLFELYLKSVGRGANLLLNVPPDENGLITPFDSASLAGFRKLVEKNFCNNLSRAGQGYVTIYKVDYEVSKPAPALNDNDDRSFQNYILRNKSSLSIQYANAQKLNCIVLKENLKSGQQCVSFRLLIMDKDRQLRKEINGTTIGRKRIITFPAINANSVDLQITEKKGTTGIAEIESYLVDDSLIEKNN